MYGCVCVCVCGRVWQCWQQQKWKQWESMQSCIKMMFISITYRALSKIFLLLITGFFASINTTCHINQVFPLNNTGCTSKWRPAWLRFNIFIIAAHFRIDWQPYIAYSTALASYSVCSAYLFLLLPSFLFLSLSPPRLVDFNLDVGFKCYCGQFDTFDWATTFACAFKCGIPLSLYPSLSQLL